MAVPAGIAERGAVSHPKSLWRKLAVGAMAAAGFAYIVLLYNLALTPAGVADRDYIQYWAAGVQLAHHANPYDAAAIYQMERHAGLEDTTPRVSLSPPVALEFALPLALVSPKTGLIAWLMAEIASLLGSIFLLRKLFGSHGSSWHLLGLAFAPVIACQMAGQLGIFFLLAFTAFLYLHRSRPFLAGASLLPFALKPHLFVPFTLALLGWSLLRRRFSILAGAVATLALSCAISLWIDPEVWAQYRRLTSSVHVGNTFLPTIGVALRFAIGRSQTWIEFLPELAACLWAVWFAWNRRRPWDWLEHGSAVMLVSVICTPYMWFTDQALLFPAVLFAIYRTEQERHVLFAFLVIEAAAILQILTVADLVSPWYVWTGPAWLAWFFYAQRTGAKPAVAAVPLQ